MYRFGEAAKAAGVTPGQLRNWLTRYEGAVAAIPGSNAETRLPGAWREFSPEEVLVFAFAAQLMRFGARADRAIEAGVFALINFGERRIWWHNLEVLVFEVGTRVVAVPDRHGDFHLSRLSELRNTAFLDSPSGLVIDLGQIVGQVRAVLWERPVARPQTVEQATDSPAALREPESSAG